MGMIWTACGGQDGLLLEDGAVGTVTRAEEITLGIQEEHLEDLEEAVTRQATRQEDVIVERTPTSRRPRRWT